MDLNIWATMYRHMHVYSLGCLTYGYIILQGERGWGVVCWSCHVKSKKKKKSALQGLIAESTYLKNAG